MAAGDEFWLARTNRGTCGVRQRHSHSSICVKRTGFSIYRFKLGLSRLLWGASCVLREYAVTEGEFELQSLRHLANRPGARWLRLYATSPPRTVSLVHPINTML